VVWIISESTMFMIAIIGLIYIISAPITASLSNNVHIASLMTSPSGGHNLQRCASTTPFHCTDTIFYVRFSSLQNVERVHAVVTLFFVYSTVQPVTRHFLATNSLHSSALSFSIVDTLTLLISYASDATVDKQQCLLRLLSFQMKNPCMLL
jgi:hypothetical protein